MHVLNKRKEKLVDFSDYNPISECNNKLEGMSLKRIILLSWCLMMSLGTFSQSILINAGNVGKVSGTVKTESTKKKSAKPVNEDLKKPRAKTPVEDKYKSVGYMEISGISFANGDAEKHVIDNYGTKLYAGEIKYLMPRLSYKGLSSVEKDITVYIKIIKEDGTLERGTGSPEGYTYECDLSVKPGSGQFAYLTGWGRNSGGSYSSGLYGFEVWYNGKMLYQTDVRLYSGSNPLVTNSIFKITRMVFGSEDKESNVNIPYGEKLYEGDVKYLTENIYYEGLYANEQNISLYVRIFFPTGSMSSGTSSPTGFSYKRDVTIKPGANVLKIAGWGNNSGTTYKEGVHKYEIWLDGEKIYETSFTVYKKTTSYETVQASSSIGQFFPLWGITLGQTTWKQAENLGHKVEIWKEGPDRTMDVNSVGFWDHDGVGRFTSLYWVYYHSDFPSSWRSKGFSWENSYDTWLKVFKNLGFEVNVLRGPVTKEYSGRQTLSADVEAISADGLLEFDLDFDYGEDGCYTTSPKTLFSIRIRYIGDK